MGLSGRAVSVRGARPRINPSGFPGRIESGEYDHSVVGTHANRAHQRQIQRSGSVSADREDIAFGELGSCEPSVMLVRLHTKTRYLGGWLPQLRGGLEVCLWERLGAISA